MRKILKYFILTLTISLILNLYDIESNEKFDIIKYYKSKYKANCASQKITDNFGNGYDSLYGTRNMRTVLYGICYRGGANNYYHKSNKRNNRNPLPTDGIINLSNQGFSSAVYLYSQNYLNAPKFYYNPIQKDTFYYYNNTLSNRNQIKELLLLIKKVIDSENLGPIYLHCWNGWHQSGYAAALILMQFCDISNKVALKYWENNVDGVTKGYDHIKKKILEFEKFKEISIPDSVKKEICPCLE